MLRYCQCYGWTVEVRSKLWRCRRETACPCFGTRPWYCQQVHHSRSQSAAWHVWLHCVEQIAWLMEPVCFVAQGGDLARNAAFNVKPMQITKEINGVLLTCGSIADDSSKLVLDYL